MGKRNIYVASSWRNPIHSEVVSALRKLGHSVYNFREKGGFHWSMIDPNWKNWTKEEYRFQLLKSDLAHKGFGRDIKEMEAADTFVGVMPFGRSASLEMGWAAGKRKETILLLSDGEPELMVKMLDHICCDIGEVLSILKGMSI